MRIRMAFLDIETSKLDEFRTLDAGASVAAADNDGRYLVWVESGSTNFTGYPWRMYAMELATREIWLIDAAADGQGNWPWGAGLDVDDGRVIYLTLTYNAEGIEANEIRLLDIESRTRTVIATPGERRSRLVTPPSVSGDSAVWVEGRLWPDGDPLSSTLYLTDLSTGRKRALDHDSDGWPLIQGERVLFSSAGEVHLMNLETGEDLILAEDQRYPSALTLLGDMALWQVQLQGGGFVDMVFDPAVGEAAELGEPMKMPLEFNDQIISWWSVGPAGETDAHGDRGYQYLQWVEMPEEWGG